MTHMKYVIKNALGVVGISGLLASFWFFIAKRRRKEDEEEELEIRDNSNDNITNSVTEMTHMKWIDFIILIQFLFMSTSRTVIW
jgi:LPXTG-motif cell wall-anchored protein